jgi:hypothetical protein
VTPSRFSIPSLSCRHASPRVGVVALLILLAVALLPRPSAAADLDHLKSLISQLASDNPQTRELALGSLMDLHRKDLPDLHAAAVALRPLLPAQIASLREAVSQVFLAGEKYRADPNDPSAFLGILFTYNEKPEGLYVVNRIQGFASYRYLQSGDIIVRLVDLPAMRLQDVNSLLVAIHHFLPGDILRLGILRAGKPMSVSIPLDIRPADIPKNTTLGPNGEDEWIHERQQHAAEYWKENFSSIDPGAQPDETQASTSLEQ